ncbi:MAG: D-glycero-beta-D-manno-heptose 1-phosphate adenylyltransferase [Planctomycetota bacterium]|jgi:D-beta-D-heptose 7-phosphate kinase/D-beta-D-heptose 1-phosphate adenosyltransferase
MPTLIEKLASWEPFTALVVGDFMLDQSVYGAAERLSPDAPVPVLQASRFEDSPGGAANVGLCLRELKAEVLCFGVVGPDREAEALRQALRRAGCDAEGLLEDPARPTTIKRSMIGLAQHRHPQKMFRLDLEVRDHLGEDLVQRLLERVSAALEGADVVCLEDYDKGVCSPELCRRLIELCRARGKPILVDPAAIADYSKYRGATVITPNRSEAELATGLDTPLEASQIHNAGLATKLLTDLDLDAVVLTLDRHGALLEQRGMDPVVVPTDVRSVYDVTGAGDMVLAALAGAVANGFDWLDAVRLANAAAGLEVEVFGAQPVPLVRIQREVLARSQRLGGKVRALESLLVELAVHRTAGHSIVFTNGCFDVLHAGHVAYLAEAKRMGDVLVVAINTDEQVRVQKGEGRPVFREPDRAEVLSALECVDYVTVFAEPTPHEILGHIRPDILVKGGDYAPSEVVGREVVEAYGGDVRVLAHRPGLSSSDVVRKLAEV